MIYFDGWLRELILREILIRPWESNNEYFKWNGTWKDDITNIPFYITDDVFSAMTENNGFLLGVTENAVDNTVTVRYSNIENSAGWKDAATFTGIPGHLEPASLSVGENSVFMLMKNEDSGEYHLFANNAGTLEEISSFDEEVKDMTFIEQGGIHYITGNSDGYLEMFEIYQNENEGYAVRSVYSADKPSARTLFNIFSDDSGIYLAGGGNTDWQTIEVKRDVWKSGETVYLGCKNGQYRIEETGLKGITGEKNFVREGFVYEGTLYQVFSGSLHKSKVSTVIAVCGNGVIEQGEICDSDTIQCSEWNADYISGIAACNSNCDGYNESVCEESDGW